MSQNTDLLSASPASATQPLNSSLQAALSSLDVQLEAELTRYRRHRRSQILDAASQGQGRSQGSEPLDLIYVTATGGRTQPEPANNAVSSAAIARDPQQHEESAPPDGSTPSFLLSAAPKTEETDVSASDEASAEAANLVPAEAESANGANLESSDRTNPDHYLESSEQLIESLDRSQPPKETQRHTTDSLLSPLGIGSMLLFLMASATFGYVATNPSGLSHLGLNRFFNRPTQTAATTPTPTPPASNIGAETSLPTSPNLASPEFVDLNLSNLSTLNPKPSPIPQPEVTPQPQTIPLPTVNVAPSSSVPNPVPNSSNGLRNLSAALLPQSTPSANVGSSSLKLPPLPVKPNPASPTTAASPAPSARSTPKTSPAPAASPNPVTNAEKIADDYYYVVMDYDGEQSLEKARQVVADAYTRDFAVGARIQLGAFGDAATAQVLVQELQRQGLAPQVYRP